MYEGKGSSSSRALLVLALASAEIETKMSSVYYQLLFSDILDWIKFQASVELGLLLCHRFQVQYPLSSFLHSPSGTDENVRNAARLKLVYLMRIPNAQQEG